ncbi:hypothetical protein SAMD00019534_014820 [Acytostelium subglobosum LB1]|uniref:hypothetical protein n=1 Tax=Acytostelium subglobosum LB1 TaxID=1410327 RepID=UPI00064492A7|nr:hypothetical protein SAMD00019534_014820 [Acytostelium subglobosum LB1]GAM18307.1 hypothetical protein SAMD00019534_014820 [Acytostelium subglobosum LB1]|eukprot:XP_012757527.1 hypothetical protein SAMD00019534_014820 [Acytostelium subglobosum LB1]
MLLHSSSKADQTSRIIDYCYLALNGVQECKKYTGVNPSKIPKTLITLSNTINSGKTDAVVFADYKASNPKNRLFSHQRLFLYHIDGQYKSDPNVASSFKDGAFVVAHSIPKLHNSDVSILSQHLVCFSLSTQTEGNSSLCSLSKFHLTICQFFVVKKYVDLLYMAVPFQRPSSLNGILIQAKLVTSADFANNRCSFADFGKIFKQSRVNPKSPAAPANFFMKLYSDDKTEDAFYDMTEK